MTALAPKSRKQGCAVLLLSFSRKQKSSSTKYFVKKQLCFVNLKNENFFFLTQTKSVLQNLGNKQNSIKFVDSTSLKCF